MINIAEVHMEEEEINAAVNVLRSGKLCDGEKCAEFEEEFANLVGAKYATAYSNGTTALHASFLNLIQPGDEVLVPALTFFATAAMVVYAGGVPVFCDIDPKTYCIDIKDAKNRLTKKTRAIAPVHLFGNACDIDAANDFARENDLKIIFDAAQAHLTKYKGADVGSFGDAVCYSFYATKNMTTGGEGGMIVSNNEDFINQCKLLKRQGQSQKYYHTSIGTNYRMTDMQAAIGLEQLKKLPKFTQRRREHAEQLDAGLSSITKLTTPHVEPNVKHSYHQYTIQLAEEINRDEFVQSLKTAKIGTGINYPIPLHLQPALKKYSTGALAKAEQFSKKCLSLPVHPRLTCIDLERIIAKVQALVKAH
jgi:perosamine synthetase